MVFKSVRCMKVSIRKARFFKFIFNKSFINCANLRFMHNCVENCVFFNICVENHLKLSLIWFLFVYFNKILISDLINHV